jgi:hypothetical protein
VDIAFDEKRKSCCWGVMPAKNGIAEEDDSAKAVEGSVVGDHVTIVEYLGLLLRSPT